MPQPLRLMVLLALSLLCGVASATQEDHFSAIEAAMDALSAAAPTEWEAIQTEWYAVNSAYLFLKVAAPNQLRASDWVYWKAAEALMAESAPGEFEAFDAARAGYQDPELTFDSQAYWVARDRLAQAAPLLWVAWEGAVDSSAREPLPFSLDAKVRVILREAAPAEWEARWIKTEEAIREAAPAEWATRETAIERFRRAKARLKLVAPKEVTALEVAQEDERISRLSRPPKLLRPE